MLLQTLKKGLSTALVAGLLITNFCVQDLKAAGLLSPSNAALPALEIKSHDVTVIIQDGYAITTVEQVFHNPHSQDLEAIYSFPVPEKAAVSEFTYWINGKPVTGEVLEKKQARELYEDQKTKGNEAGLAEQDSHKTFDVAVTPVKAQNDIRIRLGYMQPAHIDTSVGRYVYPLQDNTVDEEKIAFWTANETVKERFTFDMTLRSGYPVEAIRLPKHPQAVITKTADGDWNVRIDSNGPPQAVPANEDGIIQEGFQPVNTAMPNTPVSKNAYKLDTDIAMYWRLKSGLPGSVDLVTYRPDENKKGVFMMTITPGDDLKPITQGRDFVFILDKSGSMRSGKFVTLVHGVEKALNKMRAEDRFRIVLFDDTAYEQTQGYVNATTLNIEGEIRKLRSDLSGGGTNLYAGLKMGIDKLDADRTSAIILVTDGVANVGVTQQKEFLNLVDTRDVRLYTFIMGNGANRPLLNALTKRSNGTAVNISNSDDIVGAVMVAASKVTHQAMHDVDVKIKGVRVEMLSPANIGSLYRGEQLILFGHYWGSGEANVSLSAKVSGQPVKYETKFNFASTENQNPEIGRLWAFAKIEDLMAEIQDFDAQADLKKAVTDLAIEYSLVTPYTSMVVVREDVFEAMGIERRNSVRVSEEKKAMQQRLSTPTVSRRVDKSTPMYSIPRAHHRSGGSGGGNIGLIGLLLAFLTWFRSYRNAFHHKSDLNKDTA